MVLNSWGYTKMNCQSMNRGAKRRREKVRDGRKGAGNLRKGREGGCDSVKKDVRVSTAVDPSCTG